MVLAGWSAGSLCWHRGGPTDSFVYSLAVFTDGLALLPYSNRVHDSLDDQPRRRVYRQYVASGELPAWYATILLMAPNCIVVTVINIPHANLKSPAAVGPLPQLPIRRL